MLDHEVNNCSFSHENCEHLFIFPHLLFFDVRLYLGLTEFQLVPHTQTKIKAPHQDVLFHWKFTDVLSTNNTTANITTNNTTINSNNLRFGHVSRFTLKKFEIIYNGFQLSSLHGTRKLHGYDIIYVPGMSNITFVVRRNVADIREGLHFAHAQVLNKMTGAVIKTSASFKLVIAEGKSHIIILCTGGGWGREYRVLEESGNNEKLFSLLLTLYCACSTDPNDSRIEYSSLPIPKPFSYKFQVL